MTKPPTPAQLWDRCLELIKANVNEEQYANLFQPIAFESFNESNRTLLVQVPSRFICEYLDEHYAVLMKKVLSHCYGPDARLIYRLMID